jgi:tight adherence protein B
LLIESGSTLTLSRLASIMAAIAVWTFLPLHYILLLPLAQSGLVAIALALVLPLATLKIKRRKRLRRFGDQLPDAIDVLVRSLRAGHPVSGAIGLVAEEMPDPVGTEFGLCVDEMTYGLSIEQAMSNMAGRVPQSDLGFLVIAIQVQHSSGGDLAEILGNLATVIRDRSRMYAKISAVSAEGKLAAKVIGALPFVVFGALNVVAPSFFGAVYSDPLFVPLIGIAFILWVLGIVIFMKLVRIRV